MAPALVAGQALGPMAQWAIKAATRTAPAVIAAGAVGYGAHQLTGRITESRPDIPEPRPEHGDAIMSLVSPIPALAAGGLLVGGGLHGAFSTKLVAEPRVNLDTGEVVNLAKLVRRGWTTGPAMLAGAGVGAMFGAATSAGLLMPVITGTAGIFGAGAEAAARRLTPDWAKGPAEGAARVQDAVASAAGTAIDAVGDAGSWIVDGAESDRRRIQYEVDVEPGTFDPKRSLGLDGLALESTVDDPDKLVPETHDLLVEAIEEKTGSEVTVSKDTAEARR